MEYFAHISFGDVITCLAGVFMFWFFTFSAAKDKLDEKEKKFDSIKWLKDWISYKWDNIGCHLLASFYALYLGEENLTGLLMEYADKLPIGTHALGAAGTIGFMGSYLAHALKKGISAIGS